MIDIYKSLGFNEIIFNKDKQNEDIDYVKSNKYILNCIEEKYINSWEFFDKRNGIQFVVEDGLENDFDSIVPHITNNNIWNLRIMNNFYNNFFSCENAETNCGEVSINLLNADFVPSTLKYDTLKVQISAFNIGDLRIFTSDSKNISPYAKKIVTNMDDVVFSAKYSDIPKCNDERLNYLCARIDRINEVKTELFGGSLFYFVTISTSFGPLNLYFSYDSIVDKKLFEKIELNTWFKDSLYIECFCQISADPFLHENFLGINTYESNLDVCRRIFTNEKFDLLNKYLRDDCTYISSKWNLKGKDNIIDTFNSVALLDGEIILDKVLLLTTNNELMKKYEGKEILLYKECGKDFQYPFYVETDEEGKIYNIVMDCEFFAEFGIRYSYGVFKFDFEYIKDIEKLEHNLALKKIIDLQFNDNKSPYFNLLFDKLNKLLENRKFYKKKMDRLYYFSTFNIVKDIKNKVYNFKYNRSNNFGINSILFEIFLAPLFEFENTNLKLDNKYYINNENIKKDIFDYCDYYSFDDLKRIYNKIKRIEKCLEGGILQNGSIKEIDDIINRFIFPDDITYKYLKPFDKYFMLDYCKDELIEFYDDFIRYMTILINVAKKHKCDYISLFFRF